MIWKRIKEYCYFPIVLFIIFNSCKRPNSNDFEKNQWEIIGPGGGGSTFIPTFSYQNSDKFLVRCDMTGSYLTNTGGDSYRQINFANGASSYAFDPSDSNKIYIGTNFLNKSTDAGKTWKKIFPEKEMILSQKYIGDHAELKLESADTTFLPNNSSQIKNIKVDPNENGNIYFSIGNYFYFSENNGENWEKQNFEENIEYIYTNANTLKYEVIIFTAHQKIVFDKATHKISKKPLPIDVSPAFSFSAGNVKNKNESKIYALHHDVTKENAYEFVHSEIWTSSDMGDHWQQSIDATVLNEGNKPSFTMIACAENDAENAYVVCNNYDEKNGRKNIKYYGALKTADAGKSWNWVWRGGGGSGQYRVQDAQDAHNLQDSWVHKAFGGEFVQLLDVGVSPVNGNVAVVTDWYRIMKTMDGGKTWNEIYSKPNSNGTFTSRGVNVTTTYGVHFDPFNKNHIGISYTDIGYHHSFDGGKSWQRATDGIPNDWTNTCYSAVYDPKIKNKIWSVWSGIHDIPRGKMTRNPLWKSSAIAKGGVAVSVDGGKSWKPTIAGMGDNSPATSIVIDSKSSPYNRTLYTTVYSKGVFKSIDDGKTWTLKNKGIESNNAAFEITYSKNGDLFLVISAIPMHTNGKNSADIYSGAVYKSTDGAENWIKLNVTDGLLFPNGIEIDPNNANRIYLGCWANISLADLIGKEVAKSNGGDKMLDFTGGIFLSEDGGNTWKSIFDKNQYVYDITADPYHIGRFYCNTFNQAAYRSDDFGKTWLKIKGYDFHWGHRIVIDENNHKKVFITTFGSSVWHGYAKVE